MHQLSRLLEIMSTLRDPERGCPWDLKQDFKSLVPYTLEEAYEVAEAIEQGDMKEVKKELGDLLFQVVFYAQLGKEKALFDFDDIAGVIADKMVDRHPHVFSDHHYENEEAFLKAWELQKEAEKKRANEIKVKSTTIKKESINDSLMDGISKILPAMTRAVKIQKKASLIGFDWPSADAVIAKIKEEIAELEAALKEENEADNRKKNQEKNKLSAVEDELGDVLFTCVNLARKLNIDPEKALRMSNYKFSQRFRRLEQSYQFDRQQMEQEVIEKLEKNWQAIKKMPNDDDRL
jgi:nucleoside triphosphate diphosphatase